MKKYRYIFRSLMCFAVAAGMTACDNDDLQLGSADTGVLGGSDGNVIYLTDGKGSTDVTTVEFSKSHTFNIYARTSKAVSGACSVKFTYDMGVLADYNAGAASEVAAFPESLVSLANGGTVTIQSGALESNPLEITLTGSKDLDPEAVYALPLKVTAENGVIKGESDSYIALIQDCTAFPGTDKTYEGKPGMKVIGVIEVNAHNPLNVLGFTLENSGKQLFDMVVLFAANINYDAATNRVYIHCNENVQAILDNREKYLKPLQERGIKVIMGILGNHDVAGICTLDEARSAHFAQEVKHLCDTYELDGVFLDDEYTNYDEAASGKYPGFHEATYYAASRMAYDIKKAQPDRLMLIYRWFALDLGYEIEGENCGQFMDYVLNNYWVTSNPVESFPGLRQDQCGTGSWECSDGKGCFPAYEAYQNTFNLTSIREEGYGALMIFNFQCSPSYLLTPYIIDSLGFMSNSFYGEGIKYDGSWYPKDY